MGNFIKLENFSKLLPYVDMFKEGLIVTVLLAFFTVIIGFVLALVLALMRMSNFHPFGFLGLTKDGHLRDGGFLYHLSRFNPVSFLATAYVEIIRSTPVVVQVFIIYYGLGNVFKLPDSSLNRMFWGMVAVGLNSAAYMSEVIRSGIGAVPGGQMEAARCIGMSHWKAMRHVILPQAVRNILPAMCNEFVTIIKETSILGMVGIVELMFRAQSIAKQTYIFLEPYVIAAIMYFIIVFPLSKIIAAVERRMSKSVTR